MAMPSSPRQWRPTPAEPMMAAAPRRFRPERRMNRLVAGDPIGVVQLGERIVVETRNAFGGEFAEDDDLERFMLREDRRSLSHACTGPIEVAGAGNDASLVISLRRVQASNALSCLSSSTGYLRGTFPGRKAHVHALDSRGSVALPGVLLRGAASLGMIATLDVRDRSPGRCSENGGNLDIPCLREGAKIYLPINHARAQIALGDLHFRQGAAEVSGMGLEADGEVELQLDVAEKFPYPIIETELELAVVGWGADHAAAARSAVENMLDYLKRLEPFASWAAADLYQLLGGFDLVSGNATGSVATCAQMLSKRDLLDPVTLRSVVTGPRSKPR